MMYLTPFFTIYILLVAALLGLIFGSFCNAWAWRLARGESIVHGRSHCAACGHTLAPRDLIPLVSWLTLRGKCRYCGQAISPRYPAVELISALYFVSVLLRFGLTVDALRFLPVGCLLLTAALVDLDTMELPNGLLAAAALLSLLRFPHDWKSALLGAVAVSLPLLAVVLLADKLLGRETMGGGDIKLIAVLGLHFGPLQTLFLLILACLLGLLLGAAMKKKKDAPFPFGPALVMAGWITMLAGKTAVVWYLGLF
ncbi:MAG: prepilin peptidase [Bacillota bacterium]|nr:prepilin peptidase [Bacillota bacterium]